MAGPASSQSDVVLTVNGSTRSAPALPDRPLLEVLREDLDLVGTHYGCGAGDCGACSVLIDGRRAFACQTPLSEVAERPVTTIEGLAAGETLHPAQQAFLDAGGFQCGYCTPGMIMALVGFLNEKPDADDKAVLDYMNGNLCRCCGYERIAAALLEAAARVRRAKR